MLLKGPENKSAFAPHMSFTSSARVAWKQVLQQCHSVQPPRVLLPAYIGETDREGSGIMDPVRDANCDCHFYSVSDRLVPDMESIASMLAEKKFDVLLAVHYFGFVQSDLRLMRSLCDEHGVTLVEDCAHVCLLHGHRTGITGDYAFYSLHKCLATESGGVLRSNGLNVVSVSSEDQCVPAVLEQLCRTDLEAAAQYRRRNYAYLQDRLSGVSGLNPMYELTLDTVPHNFPVLIDSNRREELYFHLMNRQMPTIALYYRLVNEIDVALFPDSSDVSRSILNLPVHQDNSREGLETLAGEIRQFFES
jgi:dTDP-4-amino-4,6-dideoxygalactose transaminase